MKRMKKLFALLMTMAMVMGLSITGFAAEKSATITIDNAGENAKFNYVQIVVANPETETGWDIVDDYVDEFTGTNAFQGLDEQTILKGMIYKATNGQAGTEIPSFDTKYAAALDAICNTIAAPTAETEQGSPITVNAAGVYVIRGYEEGYNYGTMAGYVAFGPYDTTTGAPTNLVNTTVEAKRTPSSITKSSNDENKVVEIGRTVTYSVSSTVPYIAPTELASAEYWFKDTLTGGTYALNNENKVVLTVHIDGVTSDKTYYADVENVLDQETEEKIGETISYNLKELLSNNQYANKKITISYNVKVTDVRVDKDAQLGKAENDPSFGKDDETLYTGEIELIKYAADDTKDTLADNVKLSGAKFIMYKGADNSKEYAVVEDGKFVRWTSTRDDATKLVTDTQGQIKVEGLDLGTYHFEEVEAPEGYSLDSAPVSVTLALGSEQTEATGIVTATPATKLNSTLSALPSTGGMGTTLFTIAGCVIMISAAGLFFATRKKAN